MYVQCLAMFLQCPAMLGICLDVANLMERGGTGFQTMIESYEDCDETMQPVVSIYPGFLNLCLHDKLYADTNQAADMVSMSDSERIVELCGLDSNLIQISAVSTHPHPELRQLLIT